MSERSILAYFPTRQAAERAARWLHQEGYETVQVERVSRFGGEGTEEWLNPLTGNIDSLADLTLAADTGGGDSGPLLAADPGASGLAHQDDALNVEQRPYLVTVVTGEDRVNRAVHILEESGGQV